MASEPPVAGNGAGGVLGFLRSWWLIIAAAAAGLLAVNRAIDRIEGLQRVQAGLQVEQADERERLARLETSVSSQGSRLDRLIGFLAGGPAFGGRDHPGKD